MKLLREGLRLKEALDDKTRAASTRVWKKYADENKLAAYTANMLLLCEETVIPPLPAAGSADDICEILIGIAN